MTTTTLAHALSASDQSITLVDPEDLTSGQLLALDAEYCRVLKALTATQALVQRGVNGTPSAPHLAGVTVSIDVPEGFLTGPQMLPAFGIDTNVLTGLGPSDAATFQPATGGGGTPSDPDTSVQFNDAGSFGGSADFTWDGTHAFVGGSQLITYTDLASPPPGTALGAPTLPYLDIFVGNSTAAAMPALFRNNINPSINNNAIAIAALDSRIAVGIVSDMSATTQGWTLYGAATGKDLFGIESDQFVTVNAGSAVGYYALTGVDGAGVVADPLVSFYLEAPSFVHGGTATNVYGLYVQDFFGQGGATNATGVYIGEMTASGTNYSIRTGTAPSLFGGSVTATDFVGGAWQGKTLTLSGNLITTGAFNPTFAIPSSSTWTFPSGGGTLSTATGTVTSIATTSPISGGTITSTGTISLLVNTDFAWTVPQSITNANIAAVSTDGLTIQNTQAATSGVTVQQSPRLRFRSQVWNTTSVAVTNTNDFFFESVPVSGTTPTGLLKIGSSLNGASATYPLTLSSSGLLNVTASNGITTPHIGVNNSVGFRDVGSNYMGLFAGGTEAAYLKSTGEFRLASTGGFFSIGNDVFLYRPAAATFQMGADVNGAAVNQTIQGPNGITGTDKTGGNLTNRPGAGTGAGAVSSYIVQTPTAGATGTGAQTQTTRLTISEAGAVFTGKVTLLGGATFLTTSSALTDGAAASLGTLATAPSAGNPTKWIGINDNGTTRYIPAW